MFYPGFIQKYVSIVRVKASIILLIYIDVALETFSIHSNKLETYGTQQATYT